MNYKEEIQKKISDFLCENGMELVELNIKKKPYSIVEIIIYKDTGVTFDDCSFVSREIDELIDFDQIFKDKYSIEVASPGLDRNLKTLDDYRRNKGIDVEVKLYSKVNDTKNFIGKIIDYDEEKVIFDVDGENMTVDRSVISTMKQYIDFGR